MAPTGLAGIVLPSPLPLSKGEGQNLSLPPRPFGKDVGRYGPPDPLPSSQLPKGSWEEGRACEEVGVAPRPAEGS